jgi:hypothetical protein
MKNAPDFAEYYTRIIGTRSRERDIHTRERL